MAIAPSNDFIIIPDLALEKLISSAIKFLKIDYDTQVTENGDEKTSYLYYLTHNVGVQRISFFEEAKDIFFNTDPKSNKKVSISLGWPETIKHASNVIITHVGEDYADNALGVDQGVNIYEEYVPENYTPSEETNAWRETYARRYRANFRIIITGDNTNETLIIYHILKSILISFEGTQHLQYIGFQNCKIEGGDIEIRAENIPNRFAKSIKFSFDYTFRTPSIHRSKYWNNLVFQERVLEK